MGWGDWFEEKVIDPVKEHVIEPIEENWQYVVNPLLALQGEAWEEATEGEYGETIQMIADPLDLRGVRAEQAAEEARNILMSSAASGIESLEAQHTILKELYEPYYTQATETALPALQAMITGEYDYKPSAIYELQKEVGERAIKRGRAARGALGTSGTEMELASLRTGLLTEDIERDYGERLAQLQLGAGSASAISAASGALSGNVGSIYGALGEQQAAISNVYGQARQSAYSTLGNTLQNLGLYMAMG